MDEGLKKIKKLQDGFRRNQKVLEHIFQMKRAELIEFLKPICHEHAPDFGWDIARIWKTYTLQDDRDVPQRLVFAYFDSIIIISRGVAYKPEHRDERFIFEFRGIFTPQSIEQWKRRRQ